MWNWTRCDVCFYVDGDASTKRCQYCSSCNAWICVRDLNNVPRRALAMAKRAILKARGLVN